MSRGSLREWLGRLALVSASVVSVAVAAEGVLRAIDYIPQRHEVRYRVSTRGDLEIRESATVLDCYPSNPRGYFDLDLRSAAVRERYAARGMAGLDTVAATYPFAVEFDYNSHGFRDRTFGERNEGVLRVAVVGDSFTEGQGVREEHTFPRVLE